MPACQGLPSRPCPLNKCDDSVELCQGDLMLCHNCAHSRFPQLRDPNTTDIKQRIEVKANQPQVHVVGNNNNNDATGQINTGNANTDVNNGDGCPSDERPMLVQPVLAFMVHMLYRTQHLNMSAWQ